MILAFFTYCRMQSAFLNFCPFLSACHHSFTVFSMHCPLTYSSPPPHTTPHVSIIKPLEKLKQKGHEVLYVSEPIDEMTLQNIEKFSDKMITDAGREATTDLSDDEKREKERQNEDNEGFRKWLKGILGEKITRVEVSTRLVDSPATLVQSEYGVSPSMQKYLRAQAVVENDAEGQFSNVFNQAVLEVNPSHPIIQRLRGESYISQTCLSYLHCYFFFILLFIGYSILSSVFYSTFFLILLSNYLPIILNPPFSHLSHARDWQRISGG